VPAEAERCLSNNLAWYRSVLSTHGLAGRVAEGAWTCIGDVPPYCSNAVTVAATGAEAQVRVIGDPKADFAAAAAVVAGLAPGRPVVGYESGDILDTTVALGFRTVGFLRIWLGNPG